MAIHMLGWKKSGLRTAADRDFFYVVSYLLLNEVPIQLRACTTSESAPKPMMRNSVTSFECHIMYSAYQRTCMKLALYKHTLIIITQELIL